MNILHNFTLKNLKLNKKRSIVTIIGIILSTALICAVAGMFSSFKRTIINSIIKNDGDHHVIIYNVSKEDIDYYKNNSYVKKYYLEKDLGSASSGKYRYTDVKAYDNDSLKNVKLSKGTYPKNSKEIIVPYDSKYKLNEEIEIELTSFMDDEDINDSLNKKYKVVGILEEDAYNEYMITKLDSSDEELNIKLVYKNIKNTYKYTKEIKKDYEVAYNRDLLMWNSVSASGYVSKVYNSIVGVILGIIVVTSVFVIRNSFEISITEKMRQFGMLASIGATKKQIRKSVLFEGFLLGVVGIPLGILLGIIVVLILVSLSNFLIGDMMGADKFVVDIPLISVFISIILGSVTIVLSSLKSAIKASKVSPIVAIRSNNDIKIKKGKLKTPKIINKLFGIGGVISYKNVKRNKKKYRTTVISLVVSISIFIALSYFTESLFSVSGLIYKEYTYNVSASNNEISKSEYNRITKLDNIEDYAFWRKKNLPLKSDYNVRNSGYDEYIELLSIGDSTYKKYLKDLKLNYEDVKDKVIYIKNTDIKISGTGFLYEVFNFEEKDVLTFYTDDNEYKIEVAKITDNDNYELHMNNNLKGTFLVSDELFDKIDSNIIESSLKIKSDNPDKLEEDIEKLNIDDLQVFNYDKEAREVNRMVLWISIFLYGFIIVITLIGVTNIFNTITTNMNLRSKEFAMLKSVGMTKKEFNRMIRLESIIYGLKSLVIGCIIGTSLSYLIYKKVAGSIELEFELPIKAIIISIIFIFLVIGIIMKYSLNKINKQNVIETIRQDNI